MISGLLILLSLVLLNIAARILYYKKFGEWPKDATIPEQWWTQQNVMDTADVYGWAGEPDPDFYRGSQQSAD